MSAPTQAWPRDAAGVPYPPPPWRLRATFWVSLWGVPARRIPADTLGRDLRLRTLGGRALVATAFAVYHPGGDLAYNEVLAAVRVEARGRTFTHLSRIWVDHPASIAGARALWRIPKDAARFRFDEAANGALSADAWTAEGERIAGLSFRSTLRLPGRWPCRTIIAQTSGADEGIVETRVRAWAGVSQGRAEWDIPAAGPLGFLAGLAPLTSLRLKDVELTFGA